MIHAHWTPFWLIDKKCGRVAEGRTGPTQKLQIATVTFFLGSGRLPKADWESQIFETEKYGLPSPSPSCDSEHCFEQNKNRAIDLRQ